jgi:predicted RNase H-like HicB family nuclease
MKLTIELDREVDGRWIAEVPELNVLLYGDSKQDAIQRAQSAAREIVLDRIAHGELPPDSATPNSILPHEFLAFGESASCVRRPEANRLASRPHGGFPQDHEEGWMGGLPILVSRFRGTRPSHSCEGLKEDRPSTQRSMMVHTHACPHVPFVFFLVLRSRRRPILGEGPCGPRCRIAGAMSYALNRD